MSASSSCIAAVGITVPCTVPVRVSHSQWLLQLHANECRYVYHRLGNVLDASNGHSKIPARSPIGAGRRRAAKAPRPIHFVPIMRRNTDQTDSSRDSSSSVHVHRPHSPGKRGDGRSSRHCCFQARHRVLFGGLAHLNRQCPRGTVYSTRHGQEQLQRA